MAVRAFARRSLLAWVVLATAICGSAQCGTQEMLTGPIPGATVHAAYLEVQRLTEGQVNLPWRTAPRMPYLRFFEVRSDGPNDRLVGMYFNTTVVNKRGKMSQSERIEIYLMPREECFVQDVLVHEILHAVHRRLRFLNYPQAHSIGAEEFVHYFQGEIDLRPCSER